jgi:hypothetical protein
MNKIKEDIEKIIETEYKKQANLEIHGFVRLEPIAQAISDYIQSLVPNLLPKGVKPIHLETWAKRIKEKDGYDTILTDTLEHLAKAIRKMWLEKLLP